MSQGGQGRMETTGRVLTDSQKAPCMCVFFFWNVCVCGFVFWRAERMCIYTFTCATCVCSACLCILVCIYEPVRVHDYVCVCVFLPC